MKFALKKKNTISTIKKYQPNDIASRVVYFSSKERKNYLESFFLIEIGTHTASAEMKTTQLSQKAWLYLAACLLLNRLFSVGLLFSVETL